MIRTALSFLLVFFFACDSQNGSRSGSALPDTLSNHPSANKQVAAPASTDSISFTTARGDTFYFSSAELNEVMSRHPELVNNSPRDPEQLYHCYGKSSDFASEVGKDSYFLFYAYFLQTKNGRTKYEAQRHRLIEIYTNMNRLFSRLQKGGTFFGHQYARIPGYAEYSVYLFTSYEKYKARTYNISQQKQLFILYMQKLVEDEISNDNEILGPEKTRRKRELLQWIDAVENLITDVFYLRRAQEFLFRHYEYY